MIRQIIHINDTYITSVEELKEVMRLNYTNQAFRRDVLSFYKDGVLNKWLEEEGEKISTSFSREECSLFSDNDVYDDIHSQIVGTHVKDQIKSDFYTFLNLFSIEYQIKDNEFKPAEQHSTDGSFVVPVKTTKVIFRFKLLKQDNNDYSFRFAKQTNTLSLNGKKKGEILIVDFDFDSRKEKAELIEGTTNKLCSVSIRKSVIPDSILQMVNNLRSVRNGRHGLYFTETMVTQKQYKDVMGRLPDDIDGGDNFPIYLEDRFACQAFIDELNKLTKRQFKLPDKDQWRAATGMSLHPGYLIPLDISECKSYGDIDYKSGIYDMGTNIPEFLRVDYYIIKNNNYYCFRSSKPETKIGFHLVEEI